MLVKVISDTHNQHPKIPMKKLDCDVLIHCGDFTNKGKVSEICTFFTWFNQTPAKYKLFIPGNHDKKAINHPTVKLKAEEYGLVNLHRNLIEINEKLFWGNHYTPAFDKAGNFISPEVPPDKIWKGMPKKLDILVTHAPPYGILDFGGVRYNIHFGCPELLKALKTRGVPHHVFGHIHENRGLMQTAGGTHFYNCAMLDINHSELNTEIREIWL